MSLIELVKNSHFKERSYLYYIKSLIDEAKGNKRLLYPTYAILEQHYSLWARMADNLMPDSERTKEELIEKYLKIFGKDEG